MTQSKHSTTKHYQQLTPEERGEIEAYLNAGKSQADIARLTNCSRSTISREIKRGTIRQRNSDYLFFTKYFADTSQLIHDKARQNCRFGGLEKVCWLFFKMLKTALKRRPRIDSVDGFVHAFKQTHPDQPCPSTPTVYRYIDQGRLDIKNIDLPAKLRRHVKSNRHNHSRKNKRLAGTSTDERPDTINNRERFGDWEGDLVKGKRQASEPALMTLTERRVRYEIIVKIPNYHADTCLKELQATIDQHPGYFKTITFDNGSEFKLLDQVQGAQIYFAHPYSPWERGSNENQNGLIREYIPKGLSLHGFSEDDIAKVQDALNQKHRRTLGYANAAELIEAALAS